MNRISIWKIPSEYGNEKVKDTRYGDHWQQRSTDGVPEEWGMAWHQLPTHCECGHELECDEDIWYCPVCDCGDQDEVFN